MLEPDLPEHGSSAFASTGVAVAPNAGGLSVEAFESEEDCPICLATLGACVKTPCGHSFHKACLEKVILLFYVLFILIV